MMQQLLLDRCPHCNIPHPRLEMIDRADERKGSGIKRKTKMALIYEKDTVIKIQFNELLDLIRKAMPEENIPDEVDIHYVEIGEEIRLDDQIIITWENTSKEEIIKEVDLNDPKRPNIRPEDAPVPPGGRPSPLQSPLHEAKARALEGSYPTCWPSLSGKELEEHLTQAELEHNGEDPQKFPHFDRPDSFCKD